ncbi:MAG TPA: hypothetical protein VF212_03235 [Longimicrobiales bacterium]
MKNTTALSLACCALMLLTPGRLAAQLPAALSIEARLGGAFATGEFGATGEALDAGAGYTASVNGRWELVPGVAAYIGYERTRMACDACKDVAFDDTVVDAGAGVGAIVTFALGSTGFAPWVRAGIVRRQLQFTSDGETVASRPGYGFDLGAGIAVPVVASFALTPGIRFLNYPAEFDFEILPDKSIDVSHFGVDIGLAYQF